MITNEDARALVANMHEIAEINRQEPSHLPADNCWRKRIESRAQAYDLAAGWVEELISTETTKETKQ